MDSIVSNIGLTFMYSTPIIIAALGGLYAERSGVTNIGLEGIMLVGAFVSASLCYFLGLNASGGFYGNSVIPWLCVLAAGIVGALFSIIHAIASIKYKADQTISGTALNFLATGLTVFLAQIIFHQQRTPMFNNDFIRMKLPATNIPVLSFIRDVLCSTYSPFILAIILALISSFVMKKTKFGLRLRACGEYPQAAASMGVDVIKTRYIGVILSGLLAGLAGGIMVLTADQQFNSGTIHGFGFIAIATLIFGKWNAWGVLFAGLFFGFSNVIATFSGSFEIFSKVPEEAFFMLPYILTILALIITSGKSGAPKAVGEIYDEGKR
ncbi:MAG: ABC transporter permease [Bacilli bacterium]|jgi:simple sugar transport system permease protein|nr:ABC transporter permease [Bacilli bacterium]